MRNVTAIVFDVCDITVVIIAMICDTFGTVFIYLICATPLNWAALRYYLISDGFYNQTLFS